MNRKLLSFINKGEYIKFYKSKEWREKRQEILKRDNRECQHCKREGKFSPGECVHHIKHLRDHPLLGLENKNLITLCNKCHNIEHPEKLKNWNSNKLDIPERW